MRRHRLLEDAIKDLNYKPGETLSELNLYQKIAKITEDLGVIQKDSNAPAAMGGYRFLSHAGMLGHLRHELFKHNIVIVPNAVELVKCEPYLYKNSKGEDKQTIHTVLRFSFDVVDGDKPGDSFTAHWYGEGHDTGDKGIQKAGTSAEKYFLMKLFKVSDKDDPDALKGDETDSVATPPRKTTTSVSASMTDHEPDSAPVTAAPRSIDRIDTATVTTSTVTTSENDPELKKKQLAALIWFGEQVPPSEGWFPGKINAQVQLWDMKAKKGTLTDTEKEPGSGIKYVFGLIVESHHKICGEDCQHILAAQIASILGGDIVDPGK